jgi:hypothetical protein
MIEGARRCGLKFRQQSINRIVLGKRKDARYVTPDPLGKSHNTMTAGWAILEFLPRRKPECSSRPSLFGISIPFFERRSIPPDAVLYASAGKA